MLTNCFLFSDDASPSTSKDYFDLVNSTANTETFNIDNDDGFSNTYEYNNDFSDIDPTYSPDSSDSEKSESELLVTKAKKNKSVYKKWKIM